MNKLHKLALEHCKEMAEQLDSESIRLGNTLGIDKEEFNAEKHTYPIAGKSRKLARWIEAIIDSE